MRKLLTLAVLALLVGAPKYAQASYDGVPSTGSFTVTTNSDLAAAAAYGSLVVLDTVSLSGTRVSVGPYMFKAGVDFQIGADTNTTAANLAAAINAVPAHVVATNVAGDNTVTLTAQDVGTAYNSIGLYTSNALEISKSGTSLGRGLDNAVLRINAIPLAQGHDWYAADVASNTAVVISVAINRNPTLGRQVEAMPIGDVVYLRSLSSPEAYTLSSSNASALTPSQAAMSGGSVGILARPVCFLGSVDSLPTSNYPAGCIAYLSSDPTHIQLSTETVTPGDQSWVAK